VGAYRLTTPHADTLLFVIGRWGVFSPLEIGKAAGADHHCLM
jgi:hypothetical protein